MSKLYGMFVCTNEDDQTVTSRIKTYDSYEQMITDDKPGFYGIVDNVVYHRNGTDWVVGFPNVVKEDDYTAFEVLPTTFDIPAGTKIGDTILSENITDEEVLNSTIYKEIPASTIQTLVIRTSQINPKMSDVIIDWGDGNISSINQNEYESSKIDVNKCEGDYTFSHDYAASLLNENLDHKRYIVKIYGKQYYNIRPDVNIMSRAFEIDLPVASHIGNISKFCYRSLKMIYANFENIKYHYFENCEGIFSSCYNLIKAVGMGTAFTNAICSNLFSLCRALIYTDAKLALNSLRDSCVSSMFTDCTNLKMNIADLFPKTYQISGNLKNQKLFHYCPSLYGVVPADLLWNNKTIKWIDNGTSFLGCSDEIRAQVPVSWGGTASDDIIEKSLEEKCQELIAKVGELEDKLEEASNV